MTIDFKLPPGPFDVLLADPPWSSVSGVLAPQNARPSHRYQAMPDDQIVEWAKQAVRVPQGASQAP